MWNSRNVFNGRQFAREINLLWKLIRIPVEFHRLIYHRHMHQNVKWVLKSNQMQLHFIMKKHITQPVNTSRTSIKTLSSASQSFYSHSSAKITEFVLISKKIKCVV